MTHLVCYFVWFEHWHHFGNDVALAQWMVAFALLDPFGRGFQMCGLSSLQSPHFEKRTSTSIEAIN